MNFFNIRLTQANMITPSMRHMFFERADGEPMRYLPGQFLQLLFENEQGDVLRRSYSLASRCSGDDLASESIEFVVSYVPGGPGTCLMSQLKPGDEVRTVGPLGRLCLMPDDDNERYLLIGTGTGITPYRAMLDQISSLMKQRSLKVALLHGARIQDELLFAKEFQTFANEHDGFTYVPCLSREAPTSAHPDAIRGYVQDALKNIDVCDTQDIAYLCGNPNMVDACLDALKAEGLPPTSIRREKYVSPPLMPQKNTNRPAT